MKRLLNTVWTVLLCAPATITLHSQTVTTLYSFCAQTGCADGEYPTGLVQALNGAIYGTTGGTSLQGGASGTSRGTVFSITKAGAANTEYTFCSQTNCADGEYPSGLLQATNGYLYGTANGGGANPGPYGTGAGTIFKISPSGKLITLYNFCAQSLCTDGAFPNLGLVQAATGDLYGTTSGGGTQNFGTIFKITPSGTFTTVYNFCSVGLCVDGKYPNGGLVQGFDGNLYGTTWEGGGISTFNTYLVGTIFKVTPSGTLTTLHTFCSESIDCKDGAYPALGLIQAPNGNLYGTTSAGGTNNNCFNLTQTGPGCGTIFEITPTGVLTTLYNFCPQTNCPDGTEPNGLVRASDGNFYGTTFHGGVNGNYGTVFKMSPTGALTTLYSFCSQAGCTDGMNPSTLVQDTNGILFGTTLYGGANPAPDGFDGGTIFGVSAGLSPFLKVSPAIGIVGESVEILGTNLTGTTGVSFGGTAASFVIIGPSLIIAKVPTGAKSGFIEAVTPTATLKSNMPFEVLP